MDSIDRLLKEIQIEDILSENTIRFLVFKLYKTNTTLEKLEARIKELEKHIEYLELSVYKPNR